MGGAITRNRGGPLASLTHRQHVLLESLPRQQRNGRLSGIALSLAGVLYILWALARFEPGADPIDAVGFDSAIAMPVASLYRDANAKLEALETETVRERALAWRLQLLLNFSAGIFLLAFRVILGLLLAMLGFATLTVVIERGRLLAILEALRSGEGPITEIGPPSPPS